jgi:rhodanese-related sulfurtransferase
MTVRCCMRDVTPAEAELLVAAGSVRLLDVRTPGEYRALGHIPGALLLPVGLIAAAPATLPLDGLPLLVYCEHGVRSVYAADFLEKAGYTGVLNLEGGMSCWSGPREHGPDVPIVAGPSAWLVACADLLPRHGKALDVACGRGRHALLLAATALRVMAIDRDAAAIDFLASAASRLALPVEAERRDPETGDVDLGVDAYDLVVGFHYLHRPLFPALVRALAPGGLLIYETFTAAQAVRGKPTNPDYLLQPGELPGLVAPLQVLRQREGDYEGCMLASVAARKAT